MGENIGRIFKIAEITTCALGDERGHRAYRIETTSANGWPEGKSMYHKAMEGSQ